MSPFIPGLELNRRFHAEVVQPLLAARYPHLAYSAGLIGYGSDVLGYDTEMSTDHEWGPRLLLFLSPEDHHAYTSAIDETFRHELPLTFLSYSTNFTAPAANDGGVRHLSPGVSGDIHHHISVTTCDTFLELESFYGDEEAAGVEAE